MTSTLHHAEDVYRQSITACPETVYLARELVKSALASWGLSAYEGDAVQIMSELASNAARHSAGRRYDVWVCRHAHGMDVCVWDDGPGVPVIQQPHPFGASGRGLILVQAFAARTGWYQQGAGKTVWARVAVDARTIYESARRVGCPIGGALRTVNRPEPPAP